MAAKPKPVDATNSVKKERAGRDAHGGAPGFAVTAEPYRCPALEPRWHENGSAPEMIDG